MRITGFKIWSKKLLYQPLLKCIFKYIGFYVHDGAAYLGIHADYAYTDRGLLGKMNYLTLRVSIGG